MKSKLDQPPRDHQCANLFYFLKEKYRMTDQGKELEEQAFYILNTSNEARKLYMRKISPKRWFLANK